MDNSQINKYLFEKLKKAISGLHLEEDAQVEAPHNHQSDGEQEIPQDQEEQVFPYEIDEYSDEQILLNSEDLQQFQLLTLEDVINTEKGNQPCSICFMTYKQFPDEPIRNLPCQHIFHQSCVDKWLKEKPKCPTCKHDLRDDI